MGPMPIPPHQRFHPKVDRSAGPDGCWLWTAAVDGQGYGRFGLNGKSERAHRAAFSFAHGRPVADLNVICHRCDNPPCVNPAHLFEGTKKDNSQDAERKGRMRHYPKLGETHPRTKLSNATAIAISRSTDRTATLMVQHEVSRTIIKNIRSGRTWAAVTGRSEQNKDQGISQASADVSR